MKAIKACLTISCVLATSVLVACGSDEAATDLSSSQQAMTVSKPWYQAIALGELDGNSSVANDLNKKGQIVGTAFRARIGLYRHAFLWQDGKMTDLGALLGTSSSAEAINNKGEIVGEADGHGFLWWDGIKTDLGTLGGEYQTSLAVDINNNGLIVGNSFKTDGSTHAFIWKNGKMIDLGTLGGVNATAKIINDEDQVLGESENELGFKRGFIWQNGKMKDLGTLGGNNTIPHYMNNNGQIVGSSDTLEGTAHAFLWQRGKMQDLGTMGEVGSDASCINDNGQVVGSTQDDRGVVIRSFIWENNKMRELNGIPPESFAVQPTFINEDGQIIGKHWLNGNRRNSRAFFWKNGKVTNLGSLGFFTNAVKINNKGDIIGNGRSHVGGYGEAFIITKNRSTVVEVLDVPSDGTTVESTQDYSASNVYQIGVMGTYVWGGCDAQTCPNGATCDYMRSGDAKWLSDDCWASSFSNWSNHNYSLYVNDQNPAWESYQRSEHRYVTRMKGTGGRFKFKINECEGCYGDNYGSLKVTIFAVTP